MGWVWMGCAHRVPGPSRRRHPSQTTPNNPALLLFQDAGDQKDALRHAAAALGELRTSALAPPRYYDLHIAATSHLDRLSLWFDGEPGRGRSLAGVHSAVLAAGNVVPRVYLLVAAAAARARAKDADASLLLADVADAARGVQAPVRGLFLRAYALRALAPALAAAPTASAADFLLTNFADANRLWVRMAHQGAARPAATAAARAAVADLVGAHVTALSRLDGLDAPLYADAILPRLLEQIVACKDGLAQGYLVHALVQCFPDDFHAATLPALLAALPDLAPDARVASVFGAVLDRLAGAAGCGGEGGGGGDAPAPAAPATAAALAGDRTYAALAAAAAAVSARPDTPLADVGALYGSLARFGSATGGSPRVDAALAGAAAALSARAAAGLAAVDDDAGADALAGLAGGVLDGVGVAGVLALPGHATLLAALPPRARRAAAARLAPAAAEGSDCRAEPAAVVALLKRGAPLAEGGGGAYRGASPLTPPPSTAHALLARMMHRLRSDDVDAHYAALGAAHAALAAAAPRAAAPCLLPPLALAALDVAGRAAAAGSMGGTDPPPPEPGAGPATAAGALQFAGRLAAAVADADPALGHALCVAAAVVAGRTPALEPVAYDLCERAFALFEDGLPDSAGERGALGALVGALVAARGLTPDSRDALAHKAAACAGRLLRKADQCRALCAVARVHWQPEEAAGPPPSPDALPLARDSTKALACLQRALKAAAAAGAQAAAARRGGDRAPAEAASLHVEVLNHYLDLLADGAPAVTGEAVGKLVQLVAGEARGDGAAGDATLEAFHQNTLARVTEAEGEVAARFAGLVVA